MIENGIMNSRNIHTKPQPEKQFSMYVRKDHLPLSGRPIMHGRHGIQRNTEIIVDAKTNGPISTAWRKAVHLAHRIAE
jgi:hypothetical protein